MSNPPSTIRAGRVASLHLHPEKAGDPLTSVESIDLIESKGILGEPRYFGRKSLRTGGPSRRQVSLIEREQIAEHASALGLEVISPGAVRANIETEGIRLVPLVGARVQIGQALVEFNSARDPCEKMDAVCMGLRALMLENRQGVLAHVVRSGRVRIGDLIMVETAAVGGNQDGASPGQGRISR